MVDHHKCYHNLVDHRQQIDVTNPNFAGMSGQEDKTSEVPVLQISWGCLDWCSDVDLKLKQPSEVCVLSPRDIFVRIVLSYIYIYILDIRIYIMYRDILT